MASRPQTPPTTAAQRPRKGAGAGGGRRIHIPLAPLGDPFSLQERNLMAARRRVDNAARKLYEAQLLLADAPPEIGPGVRAEVALSAQAARRAAAQLRRKRGRKPHLRPVPATPGGPTPPDRIAV